MRVVLVIYITMALLLTSRKFPIYLVYYNQDEEIEPVALLFYGVSL